METDLKSDFSGSALTLIRSGVIETKEEETCYQESVFICWWC